MRARRVKHDEWCATINPASIHLPGRPRLCNCSAGVDQTPTTWYIEHKVRGKWKRVATYPNMSQEDVEQKFFRDNACIGRLINTAGTVTVYVPSGEEKE